MPHLKCVACRTRYHAPADPIDDVCPECGSAFEPVGVLSEVVGFRAITSRDRPAGRGTTNTQQAFVERLGDRLDRRSRDADRWTESGGGAIAKAAVLPRPARLTGRGPDTPGVQG